MKAKALRLCRGCDTWKRISEFHKGASRCQECRIVATAARAQLRARDPAFLETRRRAGRAWAARNRPRARNAHLLRSFGITSEQYDELLKQQGSVCAICRRQQADRRRRLAVDHDHNTGRIRGLLCDPCNQILGIANDDPKLLARAIEHLTK